MARLLIRVKIQIILLALGACCVICCGKDVGNPTKVSSGRISLNPKPKVHYTRTEEVKAKCPKLTPREPVSDDAAVYGLGSRLLRQRLSFRYGDWQEAVSGSTPIVPFLRWDDSTLPAKTKLASFVVTDVTTAKDQRVRQLRGTLQLTIIDGKSHLGLGIPTSSEPSFRMDRGLSVLTIGVEGIYQQTENEDVVCMLGCTFLPSPDGGIHFPNIQNPQGTKSLEKNCDIMVQLNYPLRFNLTSQAVRGTIHSLVAPGERYNFSPISVYSRFRGRLYEPAAGGFLNKACAADPSSESELAVTAYKARLEDFCALTSGYLQNSMLDIEPNFGCNATTQNCQTIGPFSSYEERTSYLVDYSTSRARLLVKRFTSSPCLSISDTDPEEIPFSFVLRLVPADESEDIALWRSGLDGHTLVAEGHWTNRSHSLCLLACKVNDLSGQTDDCTFQINLHIPLVFSITSRSIFRRQISSLPSPDHPESFFPLAFNAKLDLNKQNLPYDYSSALRYRYSRLDLAGAVLDRNEPQSRSGLKTPWFKYPSLIGEEDGHYQSLADDLTFHNTLTPKEGQKWSYLNFDLVAIDKYLPFVWSGFLVVGDKTELVPVNDTIVTQTDPKRTHRREEPRKYLNCSGTLEFLGEVDKLTIFTEGFYNPLDGKMCMVGCRSVKGSFQQIHDSSFDLVEGMDCEIEIVLSYPTTLSLWLLNPGVGVKVHSNRPVDDLYHFEDISTETYPLLYKGQREQVISAKSVEGALSILTLSLTLMCIISQLLYVQSHEESTPYISLSMLGAQALGYAIPLITGAESLLARKFDYRRDYFFQESGSVQMIIYIDKILTLVALLLFLRLFEKVWRKRSSLLELGEAANVPRERSVVVICFIIHAVGFVSVLGLHSQHSLAGVDNAKQLPEVFSPYTDPYNYNINTTVPLVVPAEGISILEAIRRGPLWQVSQEYTGLIEDLFLLPQAVGFSLWDVTGRPLRVSFFVGLSLMQIVPHVYDYLRSTHLDLYGSPIYADPSFDFYTHLGNILIPALALVLAVLVFCQQRWKGFLRLPRGFAYQPLGMKRSETELVTTNGRSHLPPIPEDDE